MTFTKKYDMGISRAWNPAIYAFSTLIADQKYYKCEKILRCAFTEYII